SVRIDSVRGNAAGIQVEITLREEADKAVYVNGRRTSKYTVENGKITVKVPLTAVTVEVK
ncbi:MAG: hypothetical protein IKA57_01785, partial [Clostridia bacterium]|nr:hypothetical protein [Clostridia bacterium]